MSYYQTSISTLFFLLVLSYGVIGQNRVVIDATTNPGQVLDEIKPPVSRLEGNFYLTDNWQSGLLKLNGSSRWIKDIGVMFDIYNNVVEIKTPDQVKVGDIKVLDQFLAFSMLDKDTIVYENIARYDRSKKGLIVVLYKDKDVLIVEKPSIKIQKPTYVETMDMGNRNEKVVRYSEYYFIQDEKLTNFKRNLKGISSLAQDRDKEIKKYIKTNKLDLKQDSDLIKAILFCKK